jgi:hypothetical protein
MKNGLVIPKTIFQSYIHIHGQEAKENTNDKTENKIGRQREKIGGGREKNSFHQMYNILYYDEL